MLGVRECEMEALQMLGLIVVAIIIGWMIVIILFQHNEIEEWRKQVDDERTR